jgi:hypothetical protein
MEHNNNNNNKKFLELVADYKIVFGSDEGKRVLSDLEKRCHEFVTTHQKGDSHETAYLEGQRSVLVFIKNALKQTNS